MHISSFRLDDGLYSDILVESILKPLVNPSQEVVSGPSSGHPVSFDRRFESHDASESTERLGFIAVSGHCGLSFVAGIREFEDCGCTLQPAAHLVHDAYCLEPVVRLSVVVVFEKNGQEWNASLSITTLFR